MSPAPTPVASPLKPSPGREAGGLTLVGVGPGDPDLLTVAAVRALRNADLVAYPLAVRGDGLAHRIAAPWLDPAQERLALSFPTGADAPERRRAWREAADRLAAAVATGRMVVLLCEGDVSLYASASYVLLALRQHHPGCPVRLIPGVTAVSAAAAAAAWPLALEQEGLLLRPTPDGPQELERLLDEAAAGARVLALLKLGRRWPWVRQVLERRGLLEDALFARRVGWADQRLCPAAAATAEEPRYFSLLLIRQGWGAVLP